MHLSEASTRSCLNPENTGTDEQAGNPGFDPMKSQKREASKCKASKDAAATVAAEGAEAPEPSVAEPHKPTTTEASPDIIRPGTPCSPVLPFNDSAQVFLRMLPYQRMPYEWNDDRKPRSFIYKGQIFDVPPLPLYELDPDVPKIGGKQHKGWQIAKSKVLGGRMSVQGINVSVADLDSEDG